MIKFVIDNRDSSGSEMRVKLYHIAERWNCISFWMYGVMQRIVHWFAWGCNLVGLRPVQFEFIKLSLWLDSALLSAFPYHLNDREGEDWGGVICNLSSSRLTQKESLSIGPCFFFFLSHLILTQRLFPIRCNGLVSALMIRLHLLTCQMKGGKVYECNLHFRRW